MFNIAFISSHSFMINFLVFLTFILLILLIFFLVFCSHSLPLAAMWHFYSFRFLLFILFQGVQKFIRGFFIQEIFIPCLISLTLFLLPSLHFTYFFFCESNKQKRWEKHSSGSRKRERERLWGGEMLDMWNNNEALFYCSTKEIFIFFFAWFYVGGVSSIVIICMRLKRV